MLTATGKKEEPAINKLLDFGQMKVEDFSTRKNLRPDFDKILNDDQEDDDMGTLVLPSVSKEKREPKDSLERHKTRPHHLVRHKLQPGDCSKVRLAQQKAQVRITEL